MALSVPDSNGVVVVPTLTGLSAPYHDPFSRGAIFGLTRGTSRARVARATLEGINYRLKDILIAVEKESGVKMQDVRIDGGASNNNFLDQAAAAAFAGSQNKFADWCSRKNMAFVNQAQPVYLGFEYFAYGLVEEGIRHLKNLAEYVKSTGAKKVLVLSAQAKYMLTALTDKLDIGREFEVIYLPEILDSITTEQLSYVYAGSFNLRYLCNADLLNKLIPNDKESFDKESIEFIPLLHADHRINKLTIWQKPVGAEYSIYGIDPRILKSIREDAAADIRKSRAEQIIVFEPSAYGILQEEFSDRKVVSYLDCLG